MKNIYCACAVAGAMAAGCAPERPTSIELTHMEGFPADSGFHKGVSAPFAGVIGDKLILAGGCNFPDIPVSEGGRKAFYSDIYMAPLDTSAALEWTKAGSLPQAIAYGVALATKQGIVCAGGTSDTAALADVFLLRLENGQAVTDTMPSLPTTMDNMSGTLLGSTIYLVGGNVDGQPSTAVFSLSLDNLADGWQQETPLPGNPRVQPVCVAQDGRIYVWGGFASGTEGRPASLNVDGLAYSPETKEWTAVATPTDSAGTPISLGGGLGMAHETTGILCTGGVDKDIFLQALQGIHTGKPYLTHPVEWYKFNRNFLLYDTTTDSWIVLGNHEEGARAGAVGVSWKSYHFIINGELKPGIRTNAITRVK